MTSSTLQPTNTNRPKKRPRSKPARHPTTRSPTKWTEVPTIRPRSRRCTEERQWQPYPKRPNAWSWLHQDQGDVNAPLQDHDIQQLPPWTQWTSTRCRLHQRSILNGQQVEREEHYRLEITTDRQQQWQRAQRWSHAGYSADRQLILRFKDRVILWPARMLPSQNQSKDIASSLCHYYIYLFTPEMECV